MAGRPAGPSCPAGPPALGAVCSGPYLSPAPLAGISRRHLSPADTHKLPRSFTRPGPWVARDELNSVYFSGQSWGGLCPHGILRLQSPPVRLISRFWVIPLSVPGAPPAPAGGSDWRGLRGQPRAPEAVWGGTDPSAEPSSPCSRLSASSWGTQRSLLGPPPGPFSGFPWVAQVHFLPSPHLRAFSHFLSRERKGGTKTSM